MTKKNCIKPVAAVVGAALVGSLSAVNLASAADNPFGATQLQGGYMMLAENEPTAEQKEAMKEKREKKMDKMEARKEARKKAMEGKCGEGKCGGDKGKKEGKCGGDKGKKEGKCGEGKCGGK